MTNDTETATNLTPEQRPALPTRGSVGHLDGEVRQMADRKGKGESYSSLKKQRDALNAQMEELKADEVEAFISETKERAAELEIDLASYFSGKKTRGPGKGKMSGPAKYRNPKDHSQTWQGRGRMASWMQELVDKGAKPETLLNPEWKD